MKQSVAFFVVLSITAVFSPVNILAQDAAKVSAPNMTTSYLSLHLGASFPTGDFASTNQNSDKSGYAQTGFSGALKFTQMLNSNFGISFALHDDVNSPNTDEIERQSMQQSPPYVTGISVTADPWKTISVLVGAEFMESLSSNSKSVFDLSLMIGYMSATAPASSFNAFIYNTSIFATSPSQHAGAFAFLIGGGFYVSVSEKISIPITLDYLSGMPHFDSITTINSFGTTTVDAYDQPISNIKLMTGIVLALN